MPKPKVTPLQKIILMHLLAGSHTCDSLTESLNKSQAPVFALETKLSTRKVQRSVEVLHRRGLAVIQGNKVYSTTAGKLATSGGI